MKLYYSGVLFSLAVSAFAGSAQAVSCPSGSDVSNVDCPDSCSFDNLGGNKGTCVAPSTDSPTQAPTDPHAHSAVCAGIIKKSDCPDSCGFSGPAADGTCYDPHTADTQVATAEQCSSQTTETGCLSEGDDLDCAWVGDEGSEVCMDLHSAQALSCEYRGNKNAGSCELDDKCIYANNQGAKSCTQMDGVKTANETCLTMLVEDDDEPYWRMVNASVGCVGGTICTVTNAPIGLSFNQEVEGICQDTECIGKNVPGNCNGNIENKDQCSSETERVTICHRTCSRKNPWVRITIDEDAWDGEGCGHQQHDIRDECSNKAPWSEWGPNRRDYLIVRHGTRAHVASTNNFNTAQEKAYWRKWEPACPYVRNGACCNWDIDDPNDPDYSPCCGIQPEMDCPFDMGETDETICPYGNDAVTVVGIKSDNNRIIPDDIDPSKIFYDMSFSGTAVAPEVTFKIDNPFDFDVDTYIQYHKHPEGSSMGALDPACIAEPSKSGCNPEQASVTAGCIVPKDGEAPFSLVTVFFVSEDIVFGEGGAGVNPYECCRVPSLGNNKIIEYTFRVLCACPDATMGRRRLRAVE